MFPWRGLDVELQVKMNVYETRKIKCFINPSRIMATMLLSGSLHEQATK